MPEGVPCSAEVLPNEAVAGKRGTWQVVVRIGSGGMKVGGAIRIRPPQKGMVRWQVGKVTGAASRPGATCDVTLFDCHPITYHWRHAPIIQVDVLGQDLAEGDTVTVTIGERGGYSRGFLVRARAQEHAQTDAQWDVWVDTEGNKSLQPERAIDDPWVALEPVLMDVRPAEASRLSVIASQPAPGEVDCIMMVVARDAFGNHCADYSGEAMVLGHGQVINAHLSEGTVGGLRGVRDEVLRACAVDPTREITGTSNPVCPGIAGDYAIHFGDLHVMTGEGVIASALHDTEYAYGWASEIAGLDFCSVTNKVDRWAQDTELDDRFYAPGEFVTFPACENSFPTGHKNVYFPDSNSEPPDPATVENLFESLKGRAALVIPHHTSVYSESSRETFWTEHDFSDHRPEFERLIEITQDRGSMEREETGGNVYFGGTGSSVWSALQRGMKVGFVGGTDNHRAQPGESRSPVGGLDPDEVTVGGLTAVLSAELTREAVWDALYNRRCYATQGQRTLLVFELGGQPMGSIIEGEPAQALIDSREFRARVVGHRPVRSVELVRNDGQVTDLLEAGILDRDEELMEGSWEDAGSLMDLPAAGDARFYYLRVTEADGRMAWSSPVWIVV